MRCQSGNRRLTKSSHGQVMAPLAGHVFKADIWFWGDHNNGIDQWRGLIPRMKVLFHISIAFDFLCLHSIAFLRAFTIFAEY